MTDHDNKVMNNEIIIEVAMVFLCIVGDNIFYTLL